MDLNTFVSNNHNDSSEKLQSRPDDNTRMFSRQRIKRRTDNNNYFSVRPIFFFSQMSTALNVKRHDKKIKGQEKKVGTN